MADQRPELRRGRACRARQQRLHHSYLGSRRARPFRPGPGARAFWALLPEGRNRAGILSGSGARSRRRAPTNPSRWPSAPCRLRPFAMRSAVCTARFRRACGNPCGPACRCGKFRSPSITNGVHLTTWINGDLANLYDQHLQPDWREGNNEPETWQQTGDIPSSELWEAHRRRKRRLVSFVRERAVASALARNAPAPVVERAGEVLDPEALTIGFARRFATYKRATLVFRDLPRLKRILTNPAMPVQLVIAGKAHPKDIPGKGLIREIVQFSRDPELARPRGVRRRLRHRSRGRDGAGSRSVAEHAAPRRRGLRHQRHEGRHQRRAEPEHSGWLVRRSGRSARAAGPSATATLIRRTATKRTRRPSILCSKTKSCLCTIPIGVRGRPRQVDAAREAESELCERPL